jgi:hypothetical protein
MTSAIVWVSTKGNFFAEFFKVINAEIKPLSCQGTLQVEEKCEKK